VVNRHLGQRSGMHSERNVVAVAKPGSMGTGTKRWAFALASRLRCGATSRPTSRRLRQRPLRRSRSCEGEASLDDLLSSERMTFARTYVSNISPRLYGSRLRPACRSTPSAELRLRASGSCQIAASSSSSSCLIVTHPRGTHARLRVETGRWRVRSRRRLTPRPVHPLPRQSP
jgi:hypothetical protein